MTAVTVGFVGASRHVRQYASGVSLAPLALTVSGAQNSVTPSQTTTAMLRTRLTEALNLLHPVISAPMAGFAGGRLAGAVSAAGGLGLIGGGLREEGWLHEQFMLAGNQRVGCGFITWALGRTPGMLNVALEHGPRAIFLSFGDPAPFAPRIKAAGVVLICQIQTLADARRSIDVGADVIVAQGAEAGGHGDSRATLTLVPEVADLLAARAPETLLCAAGGIADGRGLAAALALGADGVLIGSRLYASEEATVHPNFKAGTVAASGDDTVRSRVPDILYHSLMPWPERYSVRTVRSATVETWHGRERELLEAVEADPSFGGAPYAGLENGDDRIVGAIVGEAAGLICSVATAGSIVETVVAEAEAILREKAPTWLSDE
jgi:nitronate monooxygenase